MKSLIALAAFLLLSATAAQAQSQAFVTITSATWCTVTIATQTATRVDNFNGTCDGLLTSRNAIKVINQTGNSTIHCAYDSTVSTQAISSRVGEEILAGAKVEEDLSTTAQYWCLPDSVTTAQKIVVKQARPVKLVAPAGN